MQFFNDCPILIVKTSETALDLIKESNPHSIHWNEIRFGMKITDKSDYSSICLLLNAFVWFCTISDRNKLYIIGILYVSDAILSLLSKFIADSILVD